jgi:hypothetical protein
MRLWTAAPPFGKWFGMLTILSLSKEGGRRDLVFSVHTITD